MTGIFLFIRLIFIILSVTALSFALPVLTAICYGEISVILSFLIPALLVTASGSVFFFSGRKAKIRFSTRSAFAFVAVTWISVSFLGALPLFSSGCVNSFSDAFFEAVSGFSTTGATVFNDVEVLPHSINLWRCQMHYLGGMGIIALTVALLPLLGAGGFQLVKNETTGPEKGKITSKMTDTAKLLWGLYTALLLVQVCALKLAGLSFFDSLCIGFSTLGTGGFSVLNSSIGGYNSRSVEIICTVFMFLSGVNFNLYFYLVFRRFREIRQNSEFKAYVLLFFIFTVITSFFLFLPSGNFLSALGTSSFHIASIMSTTGFSSGTYMAWSPAAQFFLFALFFAGGSSGSTAGGFKIVRWVVLFKQAKNEMLRMLHPHGVFNISLNGQVGRKDIVFNVAAFAFVYFALILFSTFVCALCSLSLADGFSISVSMISNVGISFSEGFAGGIYSSVSPALKWWLCFVMIAGRLELYSMVIFFFPDFWKR